MNTFDNTLIIGFNISNTYDKLLSGKGDRDSVYDCTRHYWANVKIEKSELADYVFGVAHCTHKECLVSRPENCISAYRIVSNIQPI